MPKCDICGKIGTNKQVIDPYNFPICLDCYKIILPHKPLLGHYMVYGIDPGDWRDGDEREWRQKMVTHRYGQKEHQIELLKEYGLKPHHTLLDIGCGWLRGGLLFIKYLDEGNYFAFDKEKWLLKCGIGGINFENVCDKKPTIKYIENFDISKFNLKFDYMLAQSVFSHISPELVKLCIKNAVDWLKPDGIFLATFFRAEHESTGSPHKNRSNEYTRATQSVEFYKSIKFAKIEYIGECGHPAGQHLLKITK